MEQASLSSSVSVPFQIDWTVFEAIRAIDVYARVAVWFYVMNLSHEKWMHASELLATDSFGQDKHIIESIHTAEAKARTWLSQCEHEQYQCSGHFKQPINQSVIFHFRTRLLLTRSSHRPFLSFIRAIEKKKKTCFIWLISQVKQKHEQIHCQIIANWTTAIWTFWNDPTTVNLRNWCDSLQLCNAIGFR